MNLYLKKIEKYQYSDTIPTIPRELMNAQNNQQRNIPNEHILNNQSSYLSIFSIIITIYGS